MERALSSWGLSFASQIDFPPFWPGTSPPRRLPGSAPVDQAHTQAQAAAVAFSRFFFHFN